MTSVKIGADPEFYLTDRTGTPVSAHNLVPGTKKEPSPLPNGGAVQVDGVAVEFNIPPASTPKEFSDGIESALNDIRKIIPKEFTFNFKPYVEFPKVYFDELPPPVKELGCDPDFNAANGQQQPSPSIHADSPFRCFGGHIHVGWGAGMEGDGHFTDCCRLTQGLEYKVPVIWGFNATYNLEIKRRQLYGDRFSFRPKTYGVEWRTPSNVWLALGAEQWEYMFKKVKQTFEIMTTGGSPYVPVYYADHPTTFTR